MLNHCEREATTVAAMPLSMSPKSRRRAEYTIKQLQTGMMVRARSTITSLAEIWKSKSDVVNGTNKSTSNHRTLDVLHVWSRQRRSASATRSQSESEDNKVLMENNNRNYRGTSYTNLNSVTADSHISNGRTSSDSTKENGTIKVATPQKPKKKCLKRFSRLKSFECDDDRHSKLTSTDMCRPSFEENLNDLNKLHRSERGHKSWLVSSSDDDQHKTKSAEHGKITNWKSIGKQETVVKARLKLQKCKANDDIVLNKTTEMIRPGILYRQNSAAPMLTIDSIDLVRKPVQASKKSLAVDEAKPRKKLSFREPVVSSPEYDNFKSKTLPKAEYLLKQYSRRQSIVRKESELDDLKLEVFEYNWSISHSLNCPVRFYQIKNLF